MSGEDPQRIGIMVASHNDGHGSVWSWSYGRAGSGPPGACAVLCPAAWHVRPDHLPPRAEWVQRVQVCPLRARQRSPPLSLQKSKREWWFAGESGKGEEAVETRTRCQNQGRATILQA